MVYWNRIWLIFFRVLKMLTHFTVPETFYFPIFAFAHRSLTVRSPSVHRAFIVRSSFALRSQFCVHRSAFARVHRSQSVHRSLIVCSATVHKTFIVRSSFTKRSAIFIRNSGVKGPFLSSVFKTVTKWGMNVCARVEENFLCISEILFLLTKRQDYQLWKFKGNFSPLISLLHRGKEFEISLFDIRKLGPLSIKGTVGFFLSETFNFFVVYIMRYFPSFV